MRIKLNWLNELVDLSNLSIEKIVNTLSLYSIEVESVGSVVSGTNLVVGHVLSRENHPDSDHLSVCTVDVGSEVLQIVCGAPNVRKDQYVIVATNGTELCGGVRIKKTRIRGIESNGMICSLSELGLEKKYIQDEYQNGIYYFKEAPQVGTPALKALQLDDVVIELGLTPNRSDMLSMIGVAFEASAIFRRPLKKLAYDYLCGKEKSSDLISVKTETEDCYAYYAQVFRNVQVKPSPWWLVSRLISFGIRPINNVVDITNYILALFGQPLHAFDYEKLGNKIVVRKARKNETIKTLDGDNRVLAIDDIVIADGQKPVAIAGVMGGADTEITETTKSIVIEAAVFNPVSVRNTSLRLGLRSDSSIRFEKGVDINRTKLALDYTCYLLQTLSEAEVLGDPAFVGIKEIKPAEIKILPDDVSRLLGIVVSEAEIRDIITSLGFEMGENHIVRVPNRRFDVKEKVDLIEEIGRIHGYEKLPTTIPQSSLAGSLTNVQKVRRQIRNTLVGLGLNETVTYSLISEDKINLFHYNQEPNSQAIELLMPLSSDHKFLRKSLAFSLIENAKYCYSRKMKDLSIFEIGKVYYKKDHYQEEEFLSILISNRYSGTDWQKTNEKADFYLIKGIIEQIFRILNMNPEFRPLVKDIPELHPRRSASIYLNGKDIGFVGCIHPQFAANHDLEELYLAEIKLSLILNKPVEIPVYQEISKVPSVERDIAVVVDRNVLAGDLVNTIKKTENKILSDVMIFDIYTGEKVDESQKSVAIKLIFTSYDTLTDDIVNSKVNKIIKALATEYHAILRT